MSKTDGIGVLSLSLEFLHVKRWPRAPHETSPKPPGATPAVFVAVNFDEPAPLDADVTELPEGDVCKRADLAANAALWHGLRLTSMQDILHVEVRSKDTAFEDTGDDYVVMASFSGPVTSFLEEAFLESDRRGAKTSFDLSDVASAQFRVKFHLQADILRALCDGVGLEVASADTIKAFAPHAVSLCGAAETLTDVFHKTQETKEREKEESFDAKAAAQEREESAAFRRRGGFDGFDFVDADNAAFGRSYAALTAGVQRFLASKRADDRADAEDRASNLVRLLSDAR
jgi:hypothetical protein